MVINGGARSGASDLAAHLQRIDTNEEMFVLEMRGVVADDLDGALSDMEAVSAGACSRRPLYHANINTAPDEVLTAEQKHRAVDRLEVELGLDGQPRAVIEHVKHGRAHMHVVWLRVDLYTMEAIPDGHNYRKHELVARELEREFGHKLVQGAHIGREGVERPKRTPSAAEMLQAERSGMSPQEATARVTELWRTTDCGKAFAAALEDAGFVLARGDGRDFVLIDRAGETHSLGRRVEGVKAAGVRQRMADLNVADLPNVEEARKQVRDLRQASESEQLKPPAEDRSVSETKAAGSQLNQAPNAAALSVNQEEVAGPEDVPATSYTDNPAIAVPPAPELTADRLAGDESEQHWRKDRENREGVNADIHDAIRDLGRTDRKTADSFRQNGRTDPQQDFEREKPALDPAPEKPHIEAEKGEALAPAAKTDRELWADRLRNLPPVSEQAQALQRQAEAQRPVSGGKAGVASDWSEATQRPSYKTEKSANSGKTRVRAALDAMREKLDSLAERLETAFARFRDRAADRPRSPIIDQRQNPQRAPQAQAKVEPVKKVRTDPPQALRQPPPEPEKPKVHKSAYDLLMEDVERMGQAGAKRSPDHAKGRDQLRDLLKDYGRSRGREWEP